MRSYAMAAVCDATRPGVWLSASLPEETAADYFALSRKKECRLIGVDADELPGLNGLGLPVSCYEKFE